jgi:hypothetical protein
MKNVSVDTVDASSFPLWRDRIGQPVESWRLWGFNDTPHVIELVFAIGSVFIGDGREEKFGDGDDIIVSDRLTPDDMTCLKMLAESV